MNPSAREKKQEKAKIYGSFLLTFGRKQLWSALYCSGSIVLLWKWYNFIYLPKINIKAHSSVAFVRAHVLPPSLSRAGFFIRLHLNSLSARSEITLFILFKKKKQKHTFSIEQKQASSHPAKQWPLLPNLEAPQNPRAAYVAHIRFFKKH